MTRLQRILIVVLLAMQPGHALGEAVPEKAKAKPERMQTLKPSDMKALSERLDDIVGRALDAEVLSAPGSDAAAGGTDADDCSTDDPFDFTEFKSVSDYASLQAVLQASGGQGAKPSMRKRAHLARAWLSAGLTTEAVAELEAAQDSESRALRTMATLIEGRTRIDLNAFRNLAYCHETAAIWLGAALLINDAPEGAILVSDRVGDIRALPLQLRARFVAVALPGLLRGGEKQLAMKLMAAFSETEINASSHLRFCKAQLDLAEAKPGARDAILQRLFSRRFQVEALTALTLQGAHWSETQAFVLKEDAIRMVAHHRSERELFRLLKLLLDREGEEVGYKALAGLVDTSLKSGSAREAAISMMAERIKSDLQSEMPLMAISAVQFLSDRPDLFPGRVDEGEVYDLAIRQAAALGYDQLSLRLADGAGSDETRDALAASVAFRRKDYDAVFEISDARPDQEGVHLLAARSAIRIGDAARLGAAQKKIKLTPEIARVMINEDVIAGHWIAPESLYELANKDADDVARMRLAQISKIRAARNAKPAEAVSVQNEKPEGGKDMHE